MNIKGEINELCAKYFLESLSNHKNEVEQYTEYHSLIATTCNTEIINQLERMEKSCRLLRTMIEQRIEK